MTHRRIRVLINPSARRGRRQFVAMPPEVECIESRSAAHFRALVLAAQSDDLDVLAIAGGDGTVAMALDAMSGVNRVPLVVLPTGSGNDFAKDLGIGDDVPALALLNAGVPRLVDVGMASWGHRHRRFCCVASVGLDEHALRIIHGSRWPRTKLLNIYAALRALVSYRPRAVRIAWEGGGFEGEVMFAAVTNTRGYGGGFLVSPAARLDDGLLDLCIVRRTERYRLLTQFPRILKGTHGAMPEVIQAQSPWVRIEGVDGELPAALDGELPDAMTPLELRCEPRAVCVLAPKGDGESPRTAVRGLEVNV